MIWIKRAVYSLLCVGVTAFSCAQMPPLSPRSTQSVMLGQSIVPLNGPWKFQTGDSPLLPGPQTPVWASPGFDDSKWENFDLSPVAGSADVGFGFTGYVPGWNVKGHAGYWGYAWYRLRVDVTNTSHEPLALQGPKDLDDGYQLFDNGVLVGSFGKFPAGGKTPITYPTQPQMFVLPGPKTEVGSRAEPQTHLLAYRVFMGPVTLKDFPDGGGLHTAPLLGTADEITAHFESDWLELERLQSSYVIFFILFFICTCAAFVIALLDRSDQVYPWVTVVFALRAFTYGFTILGSWTQTFSGATGDVIIAIILPLNFFVTVMLWWRWFRLRSPAWMPNTIVCVSVLGLICNVIGKDIFYAYIPVKVGAACEVISVASRLFMLLLVIFIVVRGVKAQGREGWLAIPTVVLTVVANFTSEFHALRIPVEWLVFGAPFSLASAADVTVACIIFVLLMRRLLQSVRSQRELAHDVKQAKEVQHVLLPESVTVPGLSIETEYRPAREVGGDFFQIIPHATNGSVLIVAGDVTGKGLPAGMLVAVIVGAIRSTAEYAFEPEAILEALNRRLLGRSEAFATCLAMTVAMDGVVTLANAGHLAPYLNGIEVPMEGALPLGMIDGVEFPVSTFHFGKGDHIIVISDGVLEAQGSSGELFGFDRLRELLRTTVSAAGIAAAAQSFGQSDDISVVSVARS